MPWEVEQSLSFHRKHLANNYPFLSPVENTSFGPDDKIKMKSRPVCFDYQTNKLARGRD